MSARKPPVVPCAVDPDRWETPHTRPCGDEPIQRAREALRICGACPRLLKCAEEARTAPPAGFIQGGVPYGEDGQPLPRCANQACRRYILGRNSLALYCGDGCMSVVRHRRSLQAVAA